LKVKYNWFEQKPAEEEGKPPIFEYVEQDSGFMKDWTLI